MIYIETGSDNVYHNFGLELYFAAEKKLDEPVLLFWRTTPTLMVGKYQNTLEEINQSYAEQHGIQVVRRLSGGGTIYTDPGGWQFTFIDYNEDAQITFTQYIAPVVDALRALGVPAEFNGRNDLVRSTSRAARRCITARCCFQPTSRRWSRLPRSIRIKFCRRVSNLCATA